MEDATASGTRIRMREAADALLDTDMADGGLVTCAHTLATGFRALDTGAAATAAGQPAFTEDAPRYGSRPGVYVLTYEHRHGRDISLHASEAAAEAARAGLARTYWSEAGRPGAPDDFPATPGDLTDEAAARLYFEAMSGTETADIAAAEVQPPGRQLPGTEASVAEASAPPAADLVTFDLTYWVSARYQVTLAAAGVEAKLRAAGQADAAAIAGRIARREITSADAREDEDGLTGDDEDVRFLARAMSRHAGLFGADEPSGPASDWEGPDDYHVRVSPESLPRPSSAGAGTPGCGLHGEKTQP